MKEDLLNIMDKLSVEDLRLLYVVALELNRGA